MVGEKLGKLDPKYAQSTIIDRRDQKIIKEEREAVVRRAHALHPLSEDVRNILGKITPSYAGYMQDGMW